MSQGNDLASIVLRRLLDKYESSKAHVDKTRTHRPIQVRMTDDTLPGYCSGIVDPNECHQLHVQLNEWAQAGIVNLKWVKHEEGNLLEYVRLEWDGIENAYEMVGRTPLDSVLKGVMKELDEWERKLSVPWLLRWLNDVRNKIKMNGRIPGKLIPVDENRRKLLLAALAGLVDKGDEALPLRLFSKRYLGSSKAFEQQVQGMFQVLVRRYWLVERITEDGSDATAISEELSDVSKLMAELGIETTHDDVTVCGPLVYRIANGDATATSAPVIDGSWFPFGLGMDTDMVARMIFQDMPVRRILTIENKANYRQYIRHERAADELVVYLGGFASPSMRRFLRKLHGFFDAPRQVLPEFRHWGDLDYGGILILQHLRDKVWPEAQPWRMEPNWLDEFSDFVEPFRPDYALKLESLLVSASYEWAYPLIRKLLDTSGTLEQEAFLV